MDHRAQRVLPRRQEYRSLHQHYDEIGDTSKRGFLRAENHCRPYHRDGDSESHAKRDHEEKVIVECSLRHEQTRHVRRGAVSLLSVGARADAHLSY